LALARVALPRGGVWEDLCYHAQQAAEKAIKAVYMYHGWVFPYVHDLDDLLNGLKAKGQQVPDALDSIGALTPYARETRYPGLPEPVTEAEYRRALSTAEAVLSWAEAVVRPKA
jgi:HEPN domain-containing protein